MDTGHEQSHSRARTDYAHGLQTADNVALDLHSTKLSTEITPDHHDDDRSFTTVSATGDPEKIKRQRLGLTRLHSSVLHQVPSAGTFPSTHFPPNEEPDAPEPTYPEGGLRANLVVLGAFCAMLSCFGLMNTMGTLQTYLSRNQLAGYSESALGWIFSIYIFMSFFCGIQIGPIFDAKGPRWLIFSGSVFLIGGVVAMGNCTKYWHFVLSFSLLAGLGTSLLFTPSLSAIAHFFARKRGTATGLATTAGSVGGIIFPLALPELFEKIGFAWSMRLLALIFLILCAAANLLIRARLPPKKGGSVWPDFRIFRDPAFAATTCGIFFIEWGLFVPITYLASWALQTEVGSTAFSYHLIAILNAASFFGRWLPGHAADRWGRFNTMIIVTVVGVASLLGLWLPGSLDGPARGSVPLAVMFSIGFGFASGSGISLTPVCVGQLCNTDQYGRYYATSYSIVSFGCLTGVPIAGEIVTRCGGDYYGLVGFTTGCYLVALASFVMVRVRAVGWGWSKKY